jgi:dephospho-CoA kinase
MINQLEVLRGNDNRLLVGVTGGIASGKTTVSNMLEELGAPVIDFDVLARQVVEPGKHAWQQIVDYFGRQVLQEDETLDRKKLSDIVFNDLEKKKKLESFIHPQINVEFVKQLNEIVSKDPNAIVQVVIPLLIELNLQYLFHKLVVVHASQEVLVERLAKRDEITEHESANMLQSQLPIEEKIGYADFLIKNNGSIEETKRQVGELWEQLNKVQKDIRGNG